MQQEIGAGATAVTWRGWDERLERPVAVKILRSTHAGDESFVRRFQREARAAASVSHGNVVDVYDVGQEDGNLYIVMQLVEGEDLKQLINRDAPLEPRRVLSIAAQVLDGLAAIHAAGIIHRDIKPQNILIGRDGVARVTDFGIAQADDDAGMTTQGIAIGTAAYMAPEQAQAGRITEATDLYAVGVVLYEMLTGFLPFNAPTAVALMLEHIQATPVPPSQRLPGRGLTSSMDAFIAQALAKDPVYRFQSAREMKQAMMPVLRGEEFSGQQPTVAVPAAQGTRQMPSQPGARRVNQQPVQRRMVAEPVVPPREREGAGLGGAVAGLLLVVLIGVAGVAAWYAWNMWQDADDSGGAVATETAPATEASEPTATIEPTATEITAPIEQIEPTDEPTEAPEPTATIEPTATLQPTEPPTEPPAPTATSEPILIEPIDGTPFD